MDLATAELAATLTEVLVTAQAEARREILAASGVGGVPHAAWSRIAGVAGDRVVALAGDRVTFYLWIGRTAATVHCDAKGERGSLLVQAIAQILAPEVFS